MARVRSQSWIVSAILFVSVTVFAADWAPTKGAPPESEKLAKMRKKAKERQRRIIYNNDGNDASGGVKTPDEFLAKRYKPTLNTQVDSVFYCTGATIMVTHQTEVGETYGEYVPKGAKDLGRDLADGIRMLKEAGTDSLELVTKFCHENNLEIFFSHRINDIHDSMPSCIWELCTWKREHPEYLLAPRENWEKIPDYNDPRRWWSAMDFEKPPVTDKLLAMHEEILRKYDIDGIEIDYFRSPMFFKPNLTFKPATKEQVAIMTRFQRRVRELAYEAGNRRGRPVLVAARVPMGVKACLHVGIDIKGWLDQDLLDVLTTGGGYVPFTMPTRELVELGHAHGVPVYPSISASGMRAAGETIEAWRGAASNAWFYGADGIVLFNTFPSTPQHPHFTQLGDPKKLVGMDKRFILDNRPCLEGDLVQGVVQTQILPKELGADPLEVDLPIGDDIGAAGKWGQVKGLKFTVQYGSRMPGDRVQLQLNGAAIEPGGDPNKDGWVSYPVKPNQFRQGDNAVRFRVATRDPAAEKAIVVQSVQLDVKYKSN